jgi:hypothetical protein
MGEDFIGSQGQLQQTAALGKERKKKDAYDDEDKKAESFMKKKMKESINSHY